MANIHLFRRIKNSFQQKSMVLSLGTVEQADKTRNGIMLHIITDRLIILGCHAAVKIQRIHFIHQTTVSLIFSNFAAPLV